MADTGNLRVPFSLRGISGLIALSVTRNTDPDALGYRSTDSTPDKFEMDPIALYQQIPTPYAWFGVRPELFDAPSRDSKYDMTWEAHSFLCVSPDAVVTRRVEAIAGFSWGFTTSLQDITFALPEALGPEAWDSHLDLLRTDYPGWIFDSGFLPA